MASVQSILVIFGEVDKLVVDDPDRTDDVAAVLGAYADPLTRGWYGKFTGWLNDAEIQPQPIDLSTTTIDEALSDLAQAPPPTGRAQARLLLAIAALGRADRGRVDDPQRRADMARAVEPLVPEMAPPGPGRDDRADGLVRLLAGRDDDFGFVFRELSDWGEMLATARDLGFIDEELAQQTVPPCQGTFVELAGGSGPIASLKTDFVTTTLSFEQASAFLDPAQWPGCTQLWCEMVLQSGGPPRRYLEVIGFDCGDPNGWRLRTCLEFENQTQTEGMRIAVANYRLAVDQTGADQLVEVDEGSITVIDEGSHVRVVTVKRLRFRGLALQRGMAMLMCALGYAAVGEEMVYSCALGGATGTSFVAGATTTSPAGDLFGVLASEVMDLTVACVNENAEAMKASASAAARGQYTMERLAQDVTRMWLRPLQDITRLSKVLLDQRETESPTGTPAREVDSLPVTFANLPEPCTFRVKEGRLAGPFGRKISGLTVVPGGSGQASQFKVTVKATVDAQLNGTFLGLIEAIGAAGVAVVPARPVVMVVH
jgi:hypothetical protein